MTANSIKLVIPRSDKSVILTLERLEVTPQTEGSECRARLTLALPTTIQGAYQLVPELNVQHFGLLGEKLHPWWGDANGHYRSRTLERRRDTYEEAEHACLDEVMGQIGEVFARVSEHAAVVAAAAAEPQKSIRQHLVEMNLISGPPAPFTVAE